MPAPDLSLTNANGVYYHVYNRGIENKTIFNDDQDYEVFLGYLKDYLSTPADPEATKKNFIIKGHTFRGSPHQSKNYFSKIELVSYRLMPNHFHLLVEQKTNGSLSGFIRSLCTRYSMYFNKKYQHSGSLFQGPYKSVLINNETLLLYLSRYLNTSEHSSYPEYLGTRITSWIKPIAELSSFYKAKTSTFKGAGNYKDFVEKYELGQKEKEILSKIVFEDDGQPLERRNPVSSPVSSVVNTPKILSSPNLELRLKTSQSLAIGGIFLLLLSVGIRNVMSSTAKNTPQPFPIPLVLSITADPTPTPAPAVEPSSTPTDQGENTAAKNPKLIIKITDESTSVNIRQGPTVQSNKIGDAKAGEVFEYTSLDSGWYEIKLADGTTGFISARYIEVIPVE